MKKIWIFSLLLGWVFLVHSQHVRIEKDYDESFLIEDDVKIDISYYDTYDSFLGLDKSGFFDEDELEPGGTMAFSIDLSIPENTEKCTINISCKRMPTGVFMNWFYRGKG